MGTHREVAELALASRELADLRAREANARDDACEVEEKLMALIERAHVDTTEFEWLRGEQDELLRTAEELRAERGVAHQKHTDVVLLVEERAREVLSTQRSAAGECLLPTPRLAPFL
jgi:hypothetical protein